MKIKLYIYQEQWAYEDTINIVPWPVKLDDEVSGSRTRIFIQEVEVEIPDISPLAETTVKKKLVKALESEKEQIQADTFVKLKAIDDRIQQLLSIEYLGE